MAAPLYNPWLAVLGVWAPVHCTPAQAEWQLGHEGRRCMGDGKGVVRGLESH